MKHKNTSAKATPKRKIKHLTFYIFLGVFVVAGGSWFAYQSFADTCGPDEWSGSCQALRGDLLVKLDANKNIQNFHPEAAGRQVLTDFGEQKRTQMVWELAPEAIWQSAPFAFALNAQRPRSACVEIVSLENDIAVIDVTIALVNPETGAVVGKTARQGELGPQKITAICSETIYNMPELADNQSNWTIMLTNKSETPIGLFRDYILLGNIR
jgi:hypothetical protein